MRIGCDLHTLVDSAETCLHKSHRSFRRFSDIVAGQCTRGSRIEKNAGEHLQCVLVVVEAETTHLPDSASHACFAVANLSVLNHSDLEQMIDDNFCERVFPEVLFPRKTFTHGPVTNIRDQPFREYSKLTFQFHSFSPAFNNVTIASVPSTS